MTRARLTTIKVSDQCHHELVLLKEAWDLRTLGDVVVKMVEHFRTEEIRAVTRSFQDPPQEIN